MALYDRRNISDSEATRLRAISLKDVSFKKFLLDMNGYPASESSSSVKTL